MSASLRVSGLFAGIGGIELGLAAHGHRSQFLSDVDASARTVLKQKFPAASVVGDVREIDALPPTDLLTAGFPCQDLSQAGRRKGITGSRSSLVNEIFRLVDDPKAPTWILLENVSYMLRLDKGRAMHTLVEELESLGYRWAYRVVDARAFGVPQRRQRVVFLASRSEDPGAVLFADQAEDLPADTDGIDVVESDRHYGFYWTEGRRGLGWARDAVPTIKGGSALNIPSAPAVWIPSDDFVGTISIRDAERLQGFEPEWTAAAEVRPERTGPRWRLVGNAVCVPMADWVGQRLLEPGDRVMSSRTMSAGERWPSAAEGGNGIRRAIEANMFPMRRPYSLGRFLEDSLRPLSLRATNGFISRAEEGRIRFPPRFIDSLRQHRSAMTAAGGSDERPRNSSISTTALAV